MNERGDTGLISVTSFHVKIPTVLVYCNFSIYSEFIYGFSYHFSFILMYNRIQNRDTSLFFFISDSISEFFYIVDISPSLESVLDVVIHVSKQFQ